MRLVERYLIKKDNDKDKLYLFRCGNFYIFINDDAKEICNVTTLKLTSVGNNLKCGFPVNSLDKYLNLFNNLKLNIEIVENEKDNNNNDEKKEQKEKIEDLMIYKQYFEMMLYIEKITIKYPKYEKVSLVRKIKELSYNGMELIIKIQREYNKNIKLSLMKDLDIILKSMQVFVRISYKNKYINVRNYEAWSRKLYNLGNLLGSWINSCLKH